MTAIVPPPTATETTLPLPIVRPVAPAGRARLCPTEKASALKVWLTQLWRNPPEIVDTPQPPLREILLYSSEGEWTTRRTGWGRRLHQFYTYGVAIPTTAVAYWLRWALERPARAAVTAATTVAAGTVLDYVPIVRWFIPAALDVTTWF